MATTTKATIHAEREHLRAILTAVQGWSPTAGLRSLQTYVEGALARMPQGPAPTAPAATPGRSPGILGGFIKAATAAGYRYCVICHAYRFPDHADCGADYLYRDCGHGLYTAPPVVVTWTDRLEEAA